MNESEFRRILERFPVVRKKTYARVEWNSLHGKDAAQSTITLLNDDVQPSAIRDSDSLHDALGTFLDVYFAANEVHAIQREFAKAQSDFLSGLNLEDINDLCAQFVMSTE